MASKIYSAAIHGLNAQIIEVEVDSSRGLRSFEIVGLPDKAVEESKERVSAAIKNIKLKPPYHTNLRVLVNLAPADLKKEGSLYDLPIALGFLFESLQTKFNPKNKIFIGELSLDGKLRPVKGVLAVSLLAQETGAEEIILPKENAEEASLIFAPGEEKTKIKIIGVENLKEAIDYLEGRKSIPPAKFNFSKIAAESFDCDVDIAYVKGQECAKRSLEIAAAGAHNLLMSGPPGGGKTILAKTISSILPPLSWEESLEVTKIYSIAGLLPKSKPLIKTPPFRSPHHTSSEVALIGGGTPPGPGEITLAHRGVLFLDEFPEFHRDALESLRQPIEEGEITLLRAKHHLSLPASFILIAAANPCPCGYLADPEKRCRCAPAQITSYQRKLSGPLIDRIDISIDVPYVKYEKLASKSLGESSETVQKRIEKARQRQKERFLNENISVSKKAKKISLNSQMSISRIETYCQIDSKSQNLLRHCVDSRKLSARGYHRVLKVARTIADLDEAEKISYNHLAEALMYRIKDEK